MKLVQAIKIYFRKLEYKRIDKIRAVAGLIGEYYLEKHKTEFTMTDMYRKARAEMDLLGVTAIDLKRNTIIITLRRPGVLIGRLGNNIDSLRMFLKKSNKELKISIKEDKIIDSLYPYIPELYDY